MSRSLSIATFVHSTGAVRRSVRTGRRNRKELTATFEDLGRAAVLSSLATRPTDDALRIEGEARAAQLGAAFDWDRSGLPVLNRGYVKMLRDFSRTSRVGDFGQALGLLVCQRVLDFPFVVDFERFCEVVGKSVTGRATRPDYVAFSSPDATHFAVVECKGRFFEDADDSGPTPWRTALAEANAQAEAGFEQLAVRRYGAPRGIDRLISIVAIGHGRGRAGISAQVMINDKTVEPWELTTRQRRALVQLCYEMWGTMAGGAALVDALRAGPTAWGELVGRSFAIGTRRYWVPPFSSQRAAPFALMLAASTPAMPQRFQPLHGIREDALRILLARTDAPDALAPTSLSSGDAEFTTASEYADGTAVLDGQRARLLGEQPLIGFLKSDGHPPPSDLPLRF